VFVGIAKYGITYRALAEMMQERGVDVDASTIFRWVQFYAPDLEKRVRWYQGYRSGFWRVDRFHGAGSSGYKSGVSFPGQSLEDDATLATALDYY
jgi:hypothetical protein